VDAGRPLARLGMAMAQGIDVGDGGKRLGHAAF
jgi:hypothetical protein